MERELFCLTGDNGDLTDDIIGRAAAGKIVERLRQSLKHRAVGVGMSQTLDKFVAYFIGALSGRRTPENPGKNQSKFSR